MPTRTIPLNPISVDLVKAGGILEKGRATCSLFLEYEQDGSVTSRVISVLDDGRTFEAKNRDDLVRKINKANAKLAPDNWFSWLRKPTNAGSMVTDIIRGKVDPDDQVIRTIEMAESKRRKIAGETMVRELNKAGTEFEYDNFGEHFRYDDDDSWPYFIENTPTNRQAILEAWNDLSAAAYTFRDRIERLFAKNPRPQ